MTGTRAGVGRLRGIVTDVGLRDARTGIEADAGLPVCPLRSGRAQGAICQLSTGCVAPAGNAHTPFAAKS
jgi:hypothetical protein